MEILIITDGVVNVTVTLERNLALPGEDEVWSVTMQVIIFDPQISFRSKSPRETLAYHTNRYLLGALLQLCFSSFKIGNNWNAHQQRMGKYVVVYFQWNTTQKLRIFEL